MTINISEHKEKIIHLLKRQDKAICDAAFMYFSYSIFILLFSALLLDSSIILIANITFSILYKALMILGNLLGVLSVLSLLIPRTRLSHLKTDQQFVTEDEIKNLYKRFKRRILISRVLFVIGLQLLLVSLLFVSLTF
ncbi:MAG: hypothetical protein ACTSQE_01480 [Candidatus Heimdallarchaeaceae archaeon]